MRLDKFLLIFLVFIEIGADLTAFQQSRVSLSFVDPVIHAPADAYEPQYAWQELWYERMPIDHFSFADNRTFRLRYLLNTRFYRDGGPILFYTGNEGDIVSFAKNTGFMWDLSVDFNAAVVFAEHRFYGKTQPFGKESYTKLENLGYLSSEQALADFALLIAYLKSEVLKNAQTSPVIAFGGSYGGMLSAWFRIKYPHIVAGALASSAPVFQFEGMHIDQGIYENIVTRSFVLSGCDKQMVSDSWQALKNLSQSEAGRSTLNSVFQLDKKSLVTVPEDVYWLISFIAAAFDYMAMVNYPYPSNFLKPLPGWPVKVACAHFKPTPSNCTAKTLAKALYGVANVYYNSTGDHSTFCANPSKCSDSAASALGSPLGWPWQACTEMAMPMRSEGMPNDFFWRAPKWTAEEAYRGCREWFGHLGYSRNLLRPDWVLQNYGDNFAAASNIIFSNGFLDPWSGGGVTSLSPGINRAFTSGVYVYKVGCGAHHLDLRHPNSCDPDDIKQLRYFQYTIILCWIKQHKNPDFICPFVPSHLNDNSDCYFSDPINCTYQNNAYPWDHSNSTTVTTSSGDIVSSTSNNILTYSTPITKTATTCKFHSVSAFLNVLLMISVLSC